MRKLILALALFPALALSAPPAPPRPGAPMDGTRRDERQRRMRIERALGLAEALDLDEQGALRLRTTLARHDERRAPVERDVTEAVRTLRAAAAGEGVSAAQVDAAVQRMRDGRERLVRLDSELLAELTSGVTPDRKARAALFLARFRPRAEPARGPGAGGYPPPRQPGRPPGAMSMPNRPGLYGPPGTPPPPPGAASPQAAQPVPGGAPPPPPSAPPPPEAGGEGPELEDWFSGE